MVKNDIEMYSTQKEEKSVVAERFITSFKNKIYVYAYIYIVSMCLQYLKICMSTN